MSSCKLINRLPFVFILLVIGLLADYGIRHFLIMPDFYVLERQQATQKMSSVVSAIHREAFHLSQLASDWAAWDDMYRFVKDSNEAFAKSNFQWESLNASGIDLVYICNDEGRIIWSGIHHPATNKDIHIACFSRKAFQATLFPLCKRNAHLYGLMLTEYGPIFISIQPIITSAKTGPVRGFLIMGRFLTSSILKQIQAQTHVSFTSEDVEGYRQDNEHNDLLKRLSRKKYAFEVLDPEHLKGFTVIDDIFGKPALLITALFKRDIVLRGQATATLTSYSFWGAFGIIGIFIGVWLVMCQKEAKKREYEISRLVEERTKELRESENQLRTLINATPDIICFKDGEGRWLEANNAARELFHLDGDECFGKKNLELANHTHPIFRQTFINCDETDEKAWSKGDLTRNEEIVEIPDGTKRIFDVIKVPIFNNDGTRSGLIVFARDVTEEKILRDKLQKAEKMQAIGLMAGGVAHDLNNILSGILTYPDLILLKLPENSEIRPFIEAVKEAGKRASGVVADLLTIARGVAAPREVANLNELLKEYLDSPEYIKLKKLYPAVQIRVRLARNLPNIFCSPLHIKKCLMNLISNACEAIEGAGEIVIETEERTISEQKPASGHVDKGKYSVITISDNGPGIDKKDLEHIFEPFYTKKIMGRSGTGLGLSIVWNTVQDHSGSIDVLSSNQGTKFILYFPCIEEEVTSSGQDLQPADVRGQGETILIVDDERQQRDLLTSLLVSLNYKVNAVSSGEEAIAFLEYSKVDLVILDMILGAGMGGRETYERIVSIYPDQKVLIVSGFCEDKDIRAIQKIGAGEFIRKPYTLVRIGLAIKTLLTHGGKDRGTGKL